MSLPTFNPPVPPHDGSKQKPEFKVLKAEFGDGYTQSAGDGINNVRQTFSPTWENIRDADAEAIVNFLEARKGYEVFLYTPPGAPQPLKWTCEELERQRHAGFRTTVNATFRQSFVLAD